MRTSRSLTISPSMLCSRGGVPAPGGGYLLPVGCLLPWGLVLGGVVSQHALTETPPWTEFLTHAYENITLPQTSFAGCNNLNEGWETFIFVLNSCHGNVFLLLTQNGQVYKNTANLNLPQYLYSSHLIYRTATDGRNRAEPTVHSNVCDMYFDTIIDTVAFGWKLKIR